MNVPVGKILVPAAKVGRLDGDGKPWKETQVLTLLQRQGETWCRAADGAWKLWKAPGRRGDLYVLWPAVMASAPGLQQVIQKKAVFTADGRSYAFCGSDRDGPALPGGVQYD